MIANIAGKAEVFMSSHSVMLLLLLLLSHLLASVCHGRPAASHHRDDVVNPLTSEHVDDDNEPNVFAVFERRHPISGVTTEERMPVMSGYSDDDATGQQQQQQPKRGRARRRRTRRSTLGWLQTALRMCNRGFTLVHRRCRRIDVDDGHLHAQVVLSEE